ncbi:hypothetical protein [Mycobacterium sp. 94-17]|uniref:hypothetical protein n=1 Tax=Mycobacterium sp. 94-17 TaxID=2986147 RepID=UPI002D1EC4E0|nr:hypothetical protein [Mycobacterium sp. 94-17]MEB4210074.1 hypothetical protein [Mycobacterium sp. 94-17]
MSFPTTQRTVAGPGTAMIRTKKRMTESALAVVCVYTFVAWVYVAVSALVAPDTLHLRLTHLFAWPHEDTFGVICFGLSFASALGWQLMRARRRCAPQGDESEG